MTTKTSQTTGQTTGLPDAYARLQASVERLYLDKLALEQELKALRMAPPVVMLHPEPASFIKRVLIRLVPQLRRRHDLRVLRGCGLFDAEWYLRTYPDVREAGLDPALHFLAHGAAEKRNPGPFFDTEHYLHLYPDITDHGLNPLLHYIVSGRAEQRSIRPGMPHGGPSVAGAS